MKSEGVGVPASLHHRNTDMNESHITSNETMNPNQVPCYNFEKSLALTITIMFIGRTVVALDVAVLGFLGSFES